MKMNPQGILNRISINRTKVEITKMLEEDEIEDKKEYFTTAIIHLITKMIELKYTYSMMIAITKEEYNSMKTI